jgi:hypothetical protein
LDTEIVLLLQLIKKNGNIENLIKQGYQYSHIAVMINKVVENEFVKISTDGMSLTEIGENALSTFNKKLNRKNSEALISPQKEYILDKVYGVYDIYLPNNINNLN